ncbi:MAG: DUF5829 family protein [Planctomycetota bacterium]|nr:DUF5829 family protein [Planctomycetota bacterium]
MLSHALLSLVALSVSPPQDAPPELLPAAPDGPGKSWRFERLDLPLSFAPDLGYSGFEELRFAPGMFEPDSASYFSYVLALRLERDHDVDAAFWQDFLERYYRGLCEAVGEGRGLDVDPDSITVALEERDDRVTLATIEMVDVFVTGKPLRLRLELESHPNPRTTELFGIVSPLPADAPVWKELGKIRERWREERPMPVFLNHLFVIPDAETYAALAGSEFLRESFGNFEARKTVRRDMSYEGVYWYGRRTYFEFLPPGTAGMAAGKSGMAFGVEVEGGTASLAEALGERGIETFAGPRTRELDGEELPWFEVMGIQAAHADSRLDLFSLEYDPRFLARWHADLPPERTGISRRAVLARYAANLGPDGPDETAEEALFEDVKEVFLALDEAERARLDAVCRTFGYEVNEGADAVVILGPEFRLVVRESSEPGGITGFRMSLRREVEERTLVLGRAKLHLKGRVATFAFGD